MDPEGKRPQPEREKTDESLRTERNTADGRERAPEQGSSDEEKAADAVVERARVNADAVLGTARGKADRKLESGGPGAALTRERAREDEVLEDERAAADEAVRLDREEQARTMAALLPLEREKTDRLLLTERARSDVALANRDDFLGMVSHDLRSLLSGILLNAVQLAEDAPDSDEGRRTLDGMARIQRYVARMNRLIGDLVDVVSIDAGKLALQRKPCDAAALLTEAVDAFSQAATEKRVSLVASNLDSPLLADLDRERMLQVLANLINNALKFTPQGGRIDVKGRRAGNTFQLSVTDTGKGIAANMLEAVFERFWQVAKTEHKGLGLGLYISRCIVDAHGGKIWAESTLGVGSTFHCTIPAVAPKTA